MTTIIGFSGKKQSGKSTSCDILFEYFTKRNTSCAIYNFADMLKNVCIDILGLTWEQCYGTDEQKNSLTKYKWDQLPFFIREKNSKIGDMSRSGFMTGREVIQIVGTDIFRNYFDDEIWLNCTLRRIKQENPKISLIGDIRFISELKQIVNNDGYIIRYLRRVDEENKDTHQSEVDLDNFDFNKEYPNNSLTVDNRDISLSERNRIIMEFVKNKVKM